MLAFLDVSLRVLGKAFNIELFERLILCVVPSSVGVAIGSYSVELKESEDVSEHPMAILLWSRPFHQTLKCFTVRAKLLFGLKNKRLCETLIFTLH